MAETLIRLLLIALLAAPAAGLPHAAKHRGGGRGATRLGVHASRPAADVPPLPESLISLEGPLAAPLPASEADAAEAPAAPQGTLERVQRLEAEISKTASAGGDASAPIAALYGEKAPPRASVLSARPLDQFLALLKRQAQRGGELPEPGELAERAAAITRDFQLSPEEAVSALGVFLLRAGGVARPDGAPLFPSDHMLFDGDELILAEPGVVARFDKDSRGWAPAPDDGIFGVIAKHPALVSLASRETVAPDKSHRAFRGGHSQVWVEQGSGRFFKLADTAREPSGVTYADVLLRETELLVALERAAVPGVPRARRVGLNPDGSVWVELDGIVDAKSLAAPLFLRKKPVEQLHLLAKAAELLHLIHQNGVVHNDVKPRNIVVNAAGEVMLIDFGIAVASGEESLAGTPMYAAPEFIKRPRSDVYSFAQTLRHLLGAVHLPESELEASGLAALIQGATRQEASERSPADMEGMRKGLLAARDYFARKAAAAKKQP